LLPTVDRARYRGTAEGYGAVTVKCAVTDAAPEALTVTVATPARIEQVPAVEPHQHQQHDGN
jgi:hypothetical protein